jgi:Dolichyl-phosphate-mannose-protein mannosyltransferase
MRRGTETNGLKRNRDLSQKRDCSQPLLLIFAPLYLYLNLFTLANFPFSLEGDQNFFCAYALRMLHGEQAYRDFFQFTPPGTDLFYLTLFRLFGPRIWVMNFAVLLVGVILCWVCFHLAQQLMERKLALLAALLFLVFIYGDRLDATHHWFSLLAGLCAVRVLMPTRTLSRFAIAGALLGVASFFTQTTGVAGLLALIVSIAWEHASSSRPWRTTLKQQALLCIAFVLAWTTLSAPFLAHAGWRQVWYLQVTYPHHYVILKHGVLFPNVHGQLSRQVLLERAQQLTLYLLLIGSYPPVLWYCWRRRREYASQNEMKLVLISLLGLSLLLAIVTRANWIRIYSVSMPAIILLLWAVSLLGKQRRYATAAIWIVIACVATKQIWSRQHAPHTLVSLPAGRAAAAAQLGEKFYWLMQHTRPGDLFFQAQWLNLYLPLDLRSPAFMDNLSATDGIPPEYIALTIQQVEQNQVKYILWSPQILALSQPYRYEQNHLDPFRTYLDTQYKRVQIFSDRDEIWERR